MIRWGFLAAIPIYAFAVYRISTQPPGQQGDRPGWLNCVLIYLALEFIALVYYTTCVLSCGNENEPLDPACTHRCLLTFLIISLILIFFLLSCMIGSQL
jgi:hypothetical protein